MTEKMEFGVTARQLGKIRSKKDVDDLGGVSGLAKSLKTDLREGILNYLRLLEASIFELKT